MMKQFIALLRGINIGKIKILMKDLRQLMEDEGFQDVQTYIQTGNILFRTDLTDISALESRIEKAIHHQFGFNITVFITERQELEQVIRSQPFKELSEQEKGRIYIALYKGEMEQKLIKDMADKNFEPEIYKIAKKAIYFYSPKSFSDSVINNNFLEKSLGIRATTRNQKTIQKLIDLSKDNK